MAAGKSTRDHVSPSHHARESVVRPWLEGVGAIAKNARRVRARTRYPSCAEWWLVPDDDILFASSSILGCGEREVISPRAAGYPDIGLWSKVVRSRRLVRGNEGSTGRPLAGGTSSERPDRGGGRRSFPTTPEE